MIQKMFQFAFLWILFALILGGRNWKFPYGVNGAMEKMELPAPQKKQ